MVNIKGLDKAKVLLALHNGTQPQGMGFLHASTMTEEGCASDIAAMNGQLYFDYYHGRPLKCDITGDEFNERLYDRDAGQGAAERAIAAIR